ncbi:MAG: hypothetical protein HY040_07925, partial [Planctomycetes bacterium]|nr:hypothetical protein [Planctomycetota bacterium]
MLRAYFLAVVVFVPNPLFAQDSAPTPDEALKLLKEGNARFASDMPREAELGSKRRIELAQRQRPIAVVLTCSDSRAAPEIIFDKRLGMLFVIRVAGNVTGPEVYGSIEYALAELKAPLIVVLGHTNCGAVGAALKGKEQPSDNLKQLINLIHPGKDLPKEKDAALEAAVRNNIIYHTQLLKWTPFSRPRNGLRKREAKPLSVSAPEADTLNQSLTVIPSPAGWAGR